MATVTLDPHERAAVVARLAVIGEAIERLPKGYPDALNVQRWRKLLEEKEQLELRIELLEQSLP
jgi:uncharacterized protein with HEPN domain